MPAGTVNLIIGPGGSLGNYLAESKDVDMLTFTGSTAVGQSIMRAAASNVKRIGLELGGKSPNVILLMLTSKRLLNGLCLEYSSIKVKYAVPVQELL